jgi:chromosomal replication initiator protein
MTLQMAVPLPEEHPLYAKHPIYRIQRAVCDVCGIAPRILLWELNYNAALQRHIAMYLSRTLTRSSLEQIGHRFGGRHHTTVMNAVRRIERLYQEDPKLRDTIDSIKGRL